MTPKRTIRKKMMPFSEWEETAVSELTEDFGRDWIRDVYVLPNGKRVYHEIYLPRSPFKKSCEIVVVDFTVMVNTWPSLKEQGVDYIDESRYTEDGWGLPVFCGEDCFERAYNWCNKFN